MVKTTLEDILNKKKVIIISGPAGSGKTTTALRISKNPNWSIISEDEFWVEIKKGHPEGEMRTNNEEVVVQNKTLDKVITTLATGNNVVLEFILYQNPPTPIIFYRNELEKQDIEVYIRLLKPTEETIWYRKKTRGRSWDQDEISQREYAKHQLSCIESDYIQKKWVIDNSINDIDVVFEKYFKNIL